MDDATGYSRLRNDLCHAISTVKGLRGDTCSARNEALDDVLDIFDKIIKDVETFKRDTLALIPHSVLDSTCKNSPVFRTCPFQLSKTDNVADK